MKEKYYIQLPDGNRLSLYDYTVNANTCLFKFISSDLSRIKAFFGSDIISYINILNAEAKLIRSYDIEAKRKECICEDTVIQEKTYRLVKDAWEETIPAITDETDGRIIQEASTLYHEPEYEEIINHIPVEMITVMMGKPAVNEEINILKQAVGIANPNNMSLEEFKSYYINQSKTALEKYLEKNPLVSTCRGKKAGVYSITKAKQDFMTSNYLAYTIKKAASPDAVLTWNETGETCEVWSEQEYLRLIVEIEAIVKPLVSHQQYLEKAIRSAADIMSVKSIDLDFSLADIRNTVNED